MLRPSSSGSCAIYRGEPFTPVEDSTMKDLIVAKVREGQSRKRVDQRFLKREHWPTDGLHVNFLPKFCFSVLTDFRSDQ